MLACGQLLEVEDGCRDHQLPLNLPGDRQQQTDSVEELGLRNAD
jgi:hypothetical protein